MADSTTPRRIKASCPPTSDRSSRLLRVHRSCRPLTEHNELRRLSMAPTSSTCGPARYQLRARLCASYPWSLAPALPALVEHAGARESAVGPFKNPRCGWASREISHQQGMYMTEYWFIYPYVGRIAEAAVQFNFCGTAINADSELRLRRRRSPSVAACAVEPHVVSPVSS